MQKAMFITLGLLVLALNPVCASEDAGQFAKGSIFLTGQIGLNTMVRTADPFAEPFDAMPFPLGASFEVMLTDAIGVGGTVMYDQWSDYLGMFGGKWTFRLFKPSFDMAYHFRALNIRGLDLFAGANLGYSFVAVSNMLGNTYGGSLKNEPHLAPFIGINLHFWPNSPGFLGRLSVTFKAAWSVTGHFSGVYGLAGPTFRL
jgi:hypothetical protein